MKDRRLCDSDYRLLTVIWDTEPVNSMELSRICEERIGWKKSTTFTLLRKLIDKKLVQNVRATVTSVVPKEEVMARETELFVKQTFNGSLPGFLVAFLGGKKLTANEADELKQLIESHIDG